MALDGEERNACTTKLTGVSPTANPEGLTRTATRTLYRTNLLSSTITTIHIIL